MTRVEPHELFRSAWQTVLASETPAKALGEVRRVDYRAFAAQVQAADHAFVDALTRSICAGDVYIFLNAFEPAALKALKDAAYDWASRQDTQEPPLLDGVGDYRSRRDWHSEDKGGYSSTYDMLHFFRWNGDPLGVFRLFDEQYRLLRVINGYPPDAIRDNRPTDGIVDRVELSHYPRGIGGIAFHSDPVAAIKFQFTATLTEFGKDFRRGGFAVGDRDGRIAAIEPLAPIGSMFGFIPSVCHGVEVIDPDQPADWDGPTGRWYAAIASVTSAVVPKRAHTVPVSGFPTLREQIRRVQEAGA